MSALGKPIVIITLAALPLVVGQEPTGRPGPPPVDVPFDRVKPDASFDLPFVTSIGSTGDAVWVLAAGSIVRIDPKKNAAGTDVALDAEPCGHLAVTDPAVWVPLCAEAGLARVDTASGEVTRTPLQGLASPAGAIVTGTGSVWVLVDGRSTLFRIDPDSRLPVADVYLPAGTSALAFGMDALWAASTQSNQVVRINPYTNLVEKRIDVGRAPGALAVGEGAVWSVNTGDGTVSRIDAKTNAVTETIALGTTGAPAAMAAGAGAIWVSVPGTPLIRIDTRTNRVTHRLSGDGSAGRPLVFAHRSLWLVGPEASVWRVDPRFVAALR